MSATSRPVSIDSMPQAPLVRAMEAARRCDLCRQPILAGERFTDDGSETAHADCVRGWFRSNFGRESLS